MHTVFSLLTPVRDSIDVIIIIKLIFMALKNLLLRDGYNYASWQHMSANHEGSVTTCDDCASQETQLAS